MVAQFRVHDYGMERCRIVSAIPGCDILQSLNQTLHLAGDTSHIEVWNLTTPRTELDEKTLSWATKPARRELILRFQLQRTLLRHRMNFGVDPQGVYRLSNFCVPGLDVILNFGKTFTLNLDSVSLFTCFRSISPINILF